MPYYTYILQSESTGMYYCGSTSDVERRLRQHNDPEYKRSKTTKRFKGPWTLVWSQEFQTRSQAVQQEKRIKNRGITRYFQENAQLIESRRRRD